MCLQKQIQLNFILKLIQLICSSDHCKLNSYNLQQMWKKYNIYQSLLHVIVHLHTSRLHSIQQTQQMAGTFRQCVCNLTTMITLLSTAWHITDMILVIHIIDYHTFQVILSSKKNCLINSDSLQSACKCSYNQNKNMVLNPFI